MHAQTLPLLASLCAASLSPLAPAAAQSQTVEPAPTASGAVEGFAATPFKVLDNVEGSWVNLNVVPVRPMTMTADQLHVYAVNTHGSVVQHYANLTGAPADTFRVPWAPVSIAIWPDFAETELLVVCQGSHALVRLDRLSGATLATLDLPFEPADLIVDHVRGHAFVSCKGVDSVVEIDLVANAIVETYRIPSKAPVFLSFDANGTDVLVAPTFSGNNSFVHKVGTLQAQVLGILDGETSPFVVNGLPDEDLFRIDPVARTVEPVLVDAGTVLFAHGINPATGDLWLLNTDANNKDPNAQSEPAINGFAVQNRLSIATLAPTGGGTVTPHTIIDLDDTDPLTPGVQYDPARSVGQPYSIEFDAAGNVLIAGLLTDNVIALRPGTSLLTELDLAEGSIPRQTMLWGTSSMFVYCWGTNVIEMWDLDAGWNQLAVLDLGHDPTPELIARGREVFYDASHSLNNNQSCASCHVEGKTDMVTWNLSDLPRDDKGPMVTQTLAGIDQTPPFHWRGERLGLIDFNPAFPGLLGGTVLSRVQPADGSGSEFDRFEAFVLSLATTANPFEDRHRILSDGTTIEPPPGFPVGSPVRGQAEFHDPDGTNCQACHTMPMGTSNVSVADARFDPNPKRTHFEVAHFKELWRKEQETVTVDFVAGISIDYPVLGSGLGHAGTSNSLFDFVDDLFALDEQGTTDVTAFVMQADQGLAPMVHQIEHLNASTLAQAQVELTRSFLPQADVRNIDLALYGTVDLPDGPRSLAWFYDRTDKLFHAEESGVLPRTLRFFLNRAQSPATNLVFVGLPVGMGRPFAADADDDGLLNLDEAQQGTDPFVADSDGDGAPDGYEVLVGSDPTEAFDVPVDGAAPRISGLRLQWITGKVAKLSWETDEPTTFRIDYGTSVGAVEQVAGSIAKRVHTAVLSDLLPSTLTGPIFEYTGTLTAFDLAGNPAQVLLPSGMTTAFQNETENVVLGDLSVKNLVVSIPTGTVVVSAGVRVDKKTGGPPALASADHVVVASLIVNGVRTSSFTSPNPTAFTVDGDPPVIPGPFVMSLPSNGSGATELDFTLTGVDAGDELRINIEAVIPIPHGYDPQNPDFTLANSMGRWDFPTTPEAFRAVELDL